MTITTAKLPHRALRLTPLALAALLMAGECRADWKFSPSMGVAETYSDNPGLQRSGEEHGQFISEAIPGFTLSSRSRRLTLAASGEWHFYAYQDKDTPNTHDRERRYAATAEARLIEDFLSVDASANGSRQAISAFGPAYSNPYSTYNRTDVQTWSISPVVRHRFGSFALLQLRATRDGVKTDGDLGATNFGNSHANSALVSLASAQTDNALGWGLQYTRQNLDTERYGASTSINASANLSYRLSRTWSAVATVGHDSYEYPARQDRTAGRSYLGGFVWTPSPRTSIDARIGHSYLGKTGSLAATQRNRRLVSRVSYTDQVTTTRSQFMLPSAIDTAGMIDQLFSSTISDPVARARAVQAYMAASGLPPTLTDNVNYLSNRFLRERRLQAAFIYSMAHSSLELAAYRSERTSIALKQSDSDLLGNQLGALNDNVRQHGLDANFSYRLSPRTTANASVAASRAVSLVNDLATPSRYYRLGMTHRFDRKTRGILELRRFSSTVGGAGGYSENALAATLSVQL